MAVGRKTRQCSWEDAMSVDSADDRRSSMQAVYAQVGDNYRQIDDLRLRLLALLPLATGTGLLVLLGGHGVSAAIDVPAGAFGMVATLSLYFYELHGIEKCAHYIDRGAQLENDLGVPGSFTNRPHHIFGVVSELLPSALIYPASFAGWLFLALYQAGPGVRSAVTVAVLVVGAAASMKTIEVMEKTRPRRRAELERRGTLTRRQHESAGERVSRYSVPGGG
jgi:hypothetical protein